MGWLERWDRHNQRVLEYHNAMGKEPPRRWERRHVVLFVGGWLVLRVVAELTFDRWGAWAATAFGVVAVVFAVIGGLIERRKRLAWEASRRRTSPPAGPSDTGSA